MGGHLIRHFSRKFQEQLLHMQGKNKQQQFYHTEILQGPSFCGKALVFCPSANQKSAGVHVGPNPPKKETRALRRETRGAGERRLPNWDAVAPDAHLRSSDAPRIPARARLISGVAPEKKQQVVKSC